MHMFVGTRFAIRTRVEQTLWPVQSKGLKLAAFLVRPVRLSAAWLEPESVGGWEINSAMRFLLNHQRMRMTRMDQRLLDCRGKMLVIPRQRVVRVGFRTPILDKMVLVTDG